MRCVNKGTSDGIGRVKGMMRRVVSTAGASGASRHSVERMLASNLAYASRSDGKRLQGADKTLIKPSGGMKKTGIGGIKARASINGFIRTADMVTRYRQECDRVSQIASCNDRAMRKSAKGALKLASKIYADGEILRAIDTLQKV